MTTAIKKRTPTQKAYRRGGRKLYADLARKSVESRIKRHIVCQTMRDATRVTTFPSRKRESDAGYDVTSPEAFELLPGSSREIRLGVRVLCPKGYFYKIVGRSSLTRKGLTVDDNVIDATYTGELVVSLRNQGVAPYVVTIGDRVAQLIFLPQIHVDFQPVAKFPPQEDGRSDEGFGSTGK